VKGNHLDINSLFNLTQQCSRNADSEPWQS